MDELDVGVIDPATLLPKALERMRARGQGGIAVDDGGAMALLLAADIADAMNTAVEAGEDPGQVAVGTVHPRHPQLGLPDALRATLTRVASISPTLGIGQGVAGLFQNLEGEHVLVRIGLDSARLVTASEVFAGLVRGVATMCYCEGPLPNVHTFEKRDVRVTGKCNYLHGAVLSCDDGSRGP